jgi:hypothetical protein
VSIENQLLRCIGLPGGMMKYFVMALALGAHVAAAPLVQAGAAELGDSPFGAIVISADEAKAIEMPKLDFKEVPEDATNYDKYYYFRRADTDFVTAFNDITECDSYARGLASGFKAADVPYPYAGTMAGAAGGIIANAMMAAIFVPGEKRRMRRVNMRQCMGFKGYERIGLSKDLWTEFNFEEGTGAEAEESRMKALKLQALVAATAPRSEKVLPR